MANLRSPRYHSFYAVQFLLLVNVLSYQYKVGDLDVFGYSHISKPAGNGSATAYAPSYGPSALPDTASSPSYLTVFGTIPQPPSSPPSLGFPLFITAVIWVSHMGDNQRLHAKGMVSGILVQ
ncbi:hypothetical protein PTKIN_Ptkin04bG0168200 [Pterospermum kingtungense]